MYIELFERYLIVYLVKCPFLGDKLNFTGQSLNECTPIKVRASIISLNCEV